MTRRVPFDFEEEEFEDDIGLKVDAEGNVHIAKETWGELQKAIAGDPGDISDENSSVYSDFFHGLLDSFTRAINNTLDTAGDNQAADAEARITTGKTPRMVLDFAAALDRLSKLDAKELAKARSLGELYVAPGETPATANPDAYGKKPQTKRQMRKHVFSEVLDNVSPLEPTAHPATENPDETTASLFDVIGKAAAREFYRHCLVGGRPAGDSLE